MTEPPNIADLQAKVAELDELVRYLQAGEVLTPGIAKMVDKQTERIRGRELALQAGCKDCGMTVTWNPPDGWALTNTRALIYESHLRLLLDLVDKTHPMGFFSPLYNDTVTRVRELLEKAAVP